MLGYQRPLFPWSRELAKNVQMFNGDEVDVGCPIEPGECSRVSNAHTVQEDNNCMRILINLLNHLKMSKCHLASPKTSSVENANLMITLL